MGKKDRDQRQALYAVLEKAWNKWVGSYSKPNVFQKKLPKISTADDSDSEYDVSDWLLEEDTWGDETNKEIAFTSNFFYDDSEKGKWVLYSHNIMIIELYIYRCFSGSIQCLGTQWRGSKAIGRSLSQGPL